MPKSDTEKESRSESAKDTPSTNDPSRLARSISDSPDETFARINDLKDRALGLQDKVNNSKKQLSPGATDALKTSLLEVIFQFERVCKAWTGRRDSLLTYTAEVKRELMPYLLLSDNARRWLEKPLGYAGDYLTMRRLYHREIDGSGIIGETIDAALMDLPPVQAVRNRRQFLRDEMIDLIESNPGSALAITSLASGSAEEVFDVLNEIDGDPTVNFNLIDVDPDATNYLRNKATTENLQELLEIYRRNAVHLINERDPLDLGSQTLIYSAGLIDYFGDDLVQNILAWAYELLPPGGRLILGNFHPRNPNRFLMDYVFDWPLTHRTGEDLRELVDASPFNESTPVLKEEDHQINIFIECEKS